MQRAVANQTRTKGQRQAASTDGCPQPSTRGRSGTACAARSVNSRFESEPSRCPPVECGIHDARGVTPYLRLVGRWLTAHDRPRGWEGAPALSELKWYL